MEPVSPVLGREVLTTGLPEKSLNRVFCQYVTKNRKNNYIFCGGNNSQSILLRCETGFWKSEQSLCHVGRGGNPVVPYGVDVQNTGASLHYSGDKKPSLKQINL